MTYITIYILRTVCFKGASRISDHFLYSHDLYIRFKGDTVSKIRSQSLLGDKRLSQPMVIGKSLLKLAALWSVLSCKSFFFLLSFAFQRDKNPHSVKLDKRFDTSFKFNLG